MRVQPLRARARLLVAILIGVAVALLVPDPTRPMLRAVIGWDVGIVVYLVLMFIVAVRATPHSKTRRVGYFSR
jgi:uncharacterized membrane protein